MPHDTHLSTREAAEMLGISLRTAQLWVENGALQAWKTEGGHRRILLSSVKKIQEEREKILKKSIGSDLSIVIVEDDDTLRKMMEMALNTIAPKPNIYLSNDGFQGLITIGKVKPKILIADLNMPNMDGFQMIRSICADENYSPSVIVVTALSEFDIHQRGGLPPHSIVLEKPFSIHDLIKTVLDIHQTK